MSDDTKTKKALPPLTTKPLEVPEDDLDAALDLMPELKNALATNAEIRDAFEAYKGKGANVVKTLAMIALNAMTAALPAPKDKEQAPAAILTHAIGALAAANILTQMFQSLMPEALGKDPVLYQLMSFIAGKEGSKTWKELHAQLTETEDMLKDIKEAIYGPTGKPPAA
jgi:hypothetical protein